MRQELRRCRLAEALYVARRMPAEIDAKLRMVGLSTRRVFADYWQQSVECWVWRIDGEIAAVGGWIGMLLGSDAEAWLGLLPLARQHWRALVRLVREMRARLCGRRIIAHVMTDDVAAMRFAGFYGLRPVGEPRNGVQVVAG